MKLVTFDGTGLAVSIQDIPENVRAVSADPGALNEEGRRLALVNGAVGRIWDLRGFAPAYGGSDGRTTIRVPMDASMLGKSWDDLAALRLPQHPHGILREPRPETSAEREAREKAAADAAAAAALARRANRVVSAVQIRLAANEMGIRDAIETLMGSAETPRSLRDYWEYSTEFQRAHPLWAQALPLLSATEAALDQLFDIAETK